MAAKTLQYAWPPARANHNQICDTLVAAKRQTKLVDSTATLCQLTYQTKCKKHGRMMRWNTVKPLNVVGWISVFGSSPNNRGVIKYSITLIYPRGSNSEHKPGAQHGHQPNAENKGLIWWYDTDKFLYQNQKKGSGRHHEYVNHQMVEKMFHVNRKESSCTGVCFSLLGCGCYRFARNWPTYHQHSVENLSNS